MKFVRNVTWEEIREAERFGEKEMSFELWDIFEEASFYGHELDNKIEENIEYVLKREGIFDPRKMSVTIPVGALYYSCYEEEGKCYYEAHFEIFDETGNNVIARGIAYGHGDYFPEDEEMMLIDMTVAMPTKYVKKLKRMVDTLKHIIWGMSNGSR